MDLFDYQKRLGFSNSYSFLKGSNEESFYKKHILDPLIENINSGSIEVITIVVEKVEIKFLIKKLIWDTKHFGYNCYSIEHILFQQNNAWALNKALNLFAKEYVKKNSYYILNVSSEDIILVQSLSNTPFLLIESRLNYYSKISPDINYNNNSKIRIASISDINSLGTVAKEMRNPFDRVHADPAFSEEIADNYLYTFAEESIKGFADIVLCVVDESDNPFGFLAGNLPQKIEGNNVSKLVLAAIDSNIQKGKLYDLLAEMMNRLRQKNTNYLTTITQSANIPAIKTWERAGFRMFKASYLFSMKK